MAHSPPTDLNRRLFALYIGTKSKNRKKPITPASIRQ